MDSNENLNIMTRESIVNYIVDANLLEKDMILVSEYQGKDNYKKCINEKLKFIKDNQMLDFLNMNEKWIIDPFCKI